MIEARPCMALSKSLGRPGAPHYRLTPDQDHLGPHCRAVISPLLHFAFKHSDIRYLPPHSPDWPRWWWPLAGDLCCVISSVITDTFLDQCGIIITTPAAHWSRGHPASLMGSWNLPRPTNIKTKSITFLYGIKYAGDGGELLRWWWVSALSGQWRDEADRGEEAGNHEKSESEYNEGESSSNYIITPLCQLAGVSAMAWPD